MSIFTVNVVDGYAVRDGVGFAINASDKASDLGMPFMVSIQWDEANGSGFYIKDDGVSEIASAQMVAEFISLWEESKHNYDASQQVDLSTLKYQTRIKARYFGRDRGKVGFTRTTSSGKDIKMQVRNDRDFTNVQSLATWALVQEQQGVVGATIKFRDGNNDVHNLTYEDCYEVYGFARDYLDSIFEVIWDHKDAIDALSTAAEVEAYDYTTGWPPI